MNEGVISRMARVEVTKKLTAAYRVGSKKEKSAVLDRFCEIMGLSPSSARQYLMDGRIQFVSATLVFGLAAFDCSLAISSSHTSLGVL